jgi:8-oxo-dGTP pyrophosphatase MutT (NUDIX family)
MVRDAATSGRFGDHDYPQVIPVPDEIRIGLPAPWSALDPEQREGFTISLVLQRLHEAKRTFDVGPMPSEPAELAMVADAPEQQAVHRSAVLVALFEEEGETQVILTRRARNLSSHRGEIALPGGRSDQDETPVETALREAREEVGLVSALVKPVGWLSPIVTFASGSAIWPVVGVLEGRPDLIRGAMEARESATRRGPGRILSHLLLSSALRRHLGRHRSHAHRAALRRHSLELARGRPGLGLGGSGRLEVQRARFCSSAFLGGGSDGGSRDWHL